MASSSKKLKKTDFDIQDDFGTTEQFVCRICGEVMSSLESYMDHCRRSHKALVDKKTIDIPKKCIFCSVYFASKQGLENHVRTIHAVNFDDSPPTRNSVVVDVPIPVTMEKKRQKRKTKAEGNSNPSQPAISVIGSSSDSAAVDSIESIISKAILSPPVDDGKTLESEQQQQEEQQQDGTFKCNFCEKTSRSSRDHVRHVKSCNPNASVYDIFEDPHECPLCKRVFRARVHLERHFHMKHRGQPWGILDPNIGAYDACNESKMRQRSAASNIIPTSIDQSQKQNRMVGFKHSKVKEATTSLVSRDEFDCNTCYVTPESPEMI